jgi:hypothetical protein
MTDHHYAATHLGLKAVDRLRWIDAADYRNSLNQQLFPSWQRSAIAYAIAAFQEARLTENGEQS